MGFIEELRRQRQKEIEEQRRSELAREGESEREQARRNARVKEEIARRRVLYDESLRRFKQSGLPTLIDELGKLGGYEFFHERERIEDGSFFFHYNNANLLSSYNTGGTHVCMMRISTKMVMGDKMVEIKSIEIETDAEGTITFKAGFFGSSTITQSHWQRDRDALEKALGKAYNRPRIERHRYTPTPPSPPDVGPGI